MSQENLQRVNEQFWHQDAEYHTAREDPDHAAHRGIGAIAGHGAASGIPLRMELAHVLTPRDGKAASVVEYSDRNQALDAAGLSG